MQNDDLMINLRIGTSGELTIARFSNAFFTNSAIAGIMLKLC